MSKKYTYEQVKEMCKENGFELLEKEYVNSGVNMKMKCENGHIIEKRLDKVRKTKCGKCKNSIKLSFEEVKEKCLLKGFKVLEDEYKNARTKMKVMCQNNHITHKTLDSIHNDNGCTKCLNRNKYDFEFFKDLLNKEGYEILIEKDSYTNCNDFFEVKCDKGHVYKTNLARFKNAKNRCRKCHVENNVGENHYAWKHEKTDKERRSKRRTIEDIRWRKDVFEKYNYSCAKCNDNQSILHAHHIFNYWSHKELRFDINNGIVLCEACHKKFHKKYGNRYNNKEQIEEFLKNQMDGRK